MSNALSQFVENINRARALAGVADFLQKTVTFDISDIYRAVIVLAASALDSYVHEVVIEKIATCINDPSRQTDALLKFPISIRWVQVARSDPNDLAWAIGSVRERHGYLSFQQPDNIADAVRLVCDKPIWPEIAKKLGTDVETIKQDLKLIVDRRNKIAHEADINPVDGTIWPIDSAMTATAVDKIQAIVEALDSLIP